MWKRRSNEEIDSLKRQEFEHTRKYNLSLSLKRFAKSFLIVFLLLCLVALLIDPEPYAIGYGSLKKVSISELPRFFSLYIFIAFTFASYRFLLSFFSPAFFNRNDQTRYICNNCFRLITSYESRTCNCGGHYENAKYYKWVEEEFLIPEEEQWLF